MGVDADRYDRAGRGGLGPVDPLVVQAEHDSSLVILTAVDGAETALVSGTNAQRTGAVNPAEIVTGENADKL